MHALCHWRPVNFLLLALLLWLLSLLRGDAPAVSAAVSGSLGTSLSALLGHQRPALGERPVPTSTTTTSTADPKLDARGCPRKPFIDKFNASTHTVSLTINGNQTRVPVVVSLQDEGGHPGARFGNQLFTAAVSILKAAKTKSALVVIPRMPNERQKQIHKLPCLRSSLGVEEYLQSSFCPTCAKPPYLWMDRNKSCTNQTRGLGCARYLSNIGIIKNMAGNGFLQDLNIWPKGPLVPDGPMLLEVLQETFRVPVPVLEPPAELPGPNDLVMHFRTYAWSLFDVYSNRKRLSFPPFAFWKWAAEHFMAQQGQVWGNFTGRLWVVTTPGCRKHPTVLKLQKELGALIASHMDPLKGDAWLGDFAWMGAAGALALSFSTFSWWAGYIGKASTIYMVLPPTPLQLPWCKLLPKDDSRYVFFDFLNNEVFTDASKAISRCQLFDKGAYFEGNNTLALTKQFYPEVLQAYGNGSDMVKVQKTRACGGSVS